MRHPLRSFCKKGIARITSGQGIMTSQEKQPDQCLCSFMGFIFSHYLQIIQLTAFRCQGHRPTLLSGDFSDEGDDPFRNVIRRNYSIKISINRPISPVQNRTGNAMVKVSFRCGLQFLRYEHAKIKTFVSRKVDL